MMCKKIITGFIAISMFVLALPVNAEEISDTSSNGNITNESTSAQNTIVQDSSTILKITDNVVGTNEITPYDYLQNSNNINNAITAIDNSTYDNLSDTEKSALDSKIDEDFQNSKTIIIYGDKNNKVSSMKALDLISSISNNVTIVPQNEATQESQDHIIASAVTKVSDNEVSIYSYIDASYLNKLQLHNLSNAQSTNKTVNLDNSDALFSDMINSCMQNVALSTTNLKNTAKENNFTTQSVTTSDQVYLDVTLYNFGVTWAGSEVGNFIQSTTFQRANTTSLQSFWCVSDCSSANSISRYPITRVGTRYTGFYDTTICDYHPLETETSGTLSFSLEDIGYTCTIDPWTCSTDRQSNYVEWDFNDTSLFGSYNDYTMCPAAEFVNNSGQFVIDVYNFVDFDHIEEEDYLSFYETWVPSEYIFYFNDR